MQRDFHYCCIKYLARSAGFDETSSQAIAYASQYVDDATEHKGIKINNIPKTAEVLVRDGKLEPICTAHKGIQYFSGLGKEVQRKVYISFHFVPAEPYAGDGLYDYRVHADSSFAKSLVRVAGDFLKNAANEEQALQGLIKLGISLHTYADTWSHERFSGRWSSADNDIERIQLQRDNDWEKISWLDQLRYNIHPDIGHAEAMYFPDQSHLSWSYEHDKSGKDVTRHNTERFLEAAEAIYNVMCDINGTLKNWKANVDAVKSCLSLRSDSIKRKVKSWKDQFPDITFEYNPEQWRADALKGDRYDWDDFQTAEDFGTLQYDATGDLKWFFFHFEAKQQRMTVTDQIRQDLL